jgi:ATP-dependent Lon protease
VIAPALNEQDLRDVPELKTGMEFRWVTTIDEVLQVALRRRSG